MAINNFESLKKPNLESQKKKEIHQPKDNIFADNEENILTDEESDHFYNEAINLSTSDSLKNLRALKFKCQTILEFNPYHENAQKLINKIDSQIDLMLHHNNPKNIVTFKKNKNNEGIRKVLEQKQP